jgi:hypothetical protein
VEVVLEVAEALRIAFSSQVFLYLPVEVHLAGCRLHDVPRPGHDILVGLSKFLQAAEMQWLCSVQPRANLDP